MKVAISVPDPLFKSADAGALSPLAQQRVDVGLRLVLELPASLGKPGVMEAAAEYLVRRRSTSLRAARR